MRKVTVSRMREGYAQTVLTLRITYVYEILNIYSSGRGLLDHYKGIRRATVTKDCQSKCGNYRVAL